MRTPKQAALSQAPAAIADRPRTSPARKVEPKKPAVSKSAKRPDKFTYALKDYTAERRESGWWISRTWTVSAGEKPQWAGPFASIESACLAIARRLATEIADRHTHSIEWHGLQCGDPLYGLKPTTRLNARRKKASTPKPNGAQ